MNILNLIFYNSINAFLKDMDPHDTHVTEHPILVLHTFEDFKSHGVLENVQEDDDLIILQSESHKGSLINFNDPIDKDENNIPNTSLTFAINHPNLVDLQRSGIYFWFTENKLEKGNFRGGNSKFTGIMAGIEFSNNKAELVFTYNHGTDYSNKESQTIHFDHINPEKLKGVDEITIKIIHTKNNFKFEIFDGDALISDSFKVTEPRLFSDNTKLHNIGITTYYEKGNSETAIDIRGLNFSSRNEGEEYENMDMHIEHNDFPRSESQEELRHAVSAASHFITYLSAVFGTHGESTITQLVMNAKNLLKLQRTKIDEMLLSLKIEENVDEDALRKENIEKLETFDNKMHTIYKKIELFKNQLDELHLKQNASTAKVGNMIIGFGIFIAGISVIKLFIEKIRNTEKYIKNE